jgi:hypothetical protein
MNREDYRPQTADHRLFKAGQPRSAVCSLRSAVFILCLVQSLFLRGQALAGEAGSGFPVSSASFSSDVGDWLQILFWLLGGVYLVVKLIKPDPPNHRQFAPIDHQHANALSKDDKDALREETTRELMTIRQEMGGMTGKVERQIDHLRDAMSTQNAQLIAALDKYTEHNEDRVRRVHARLDPLPSAIAANTRSLETHLADHRAGKE